MLEWTFWFLLRRVFFLGSDEKGRVCVEMSAGVRDFALRLRTAWEAPFVSMVLLRGWVRLG